MSKRSFIFTGKRSIHGCIVHRPVNADKVDLNYAVESNCTFRYLCYFYF